MRQLGILPACIGMNECEFVPRKQIPLRSNCNLLTSRNPKVYNLAHTTRFLSLQDSPSPQQQNLSLGPTIARNIHPIKPIPGNTNRPKTLRRRAMPLILTIQHTTIPRDITLRNRTLGRKRPIHPFPKRHLHNLVPSGRIAIPTPMECNI